VKKQGFSTAGIKYIAGPAYSAVYQVIPLRKRNLEIKQ